MKFLYQLMLCGLLFYTPKLFGAGHWEQGFVITNTGDTLKGFLKDGSDRSNSQHVFYKPTTAGTGITYLPTDIKSYCIQTTGKQYISRLVTVDSVSSKLAFLQVIVKGAASFYYCADSGSRKRYFLQLDTGVLNELQLRKTELLINGSPVIQTDKLYIGKLKSLLVKCSKIIMDPDFDNLSFALRPLAKKCLDYDKCVAPANIYVSETLKNAGAVELIPSAGISIHTIVSKATNQVLPHPQTQVGYALGFAANFFNPTSILGKGLSIQLSADFINKGTQSSVTGLYWPNTSYFVTKTVFNLHYLDGSVEIKYNYPRGNIRPFAGAGFVTGVTLNTTKAYYMVENGQKNYLSQPGYTNLFDSYNTYTELGLVTELGMKILVKKSTLLVGLRYDYTTIPLGHSTQFNNSALQLRLGYVNFIKFKSRL